MSRWSWIALILFLFAPPRAHGQGRIDCNAIKSAILGQTVHYCVMLPPGYDAAAGHAPRRYPVLYFLHGLGDNEQTLFKAGGWALIEDLRRQGQIGDFLIVAPEAKATFYINSVDGRVRYSDFFLKEFIPYIETHYSVRRERSARAISGVSMGGYGALRFAFAHPDLFSSVSAQSAALMPESPQEISASMHSGTPLDSLLGAVFGAPIDVPHWNQNSPFVLAKQNRSRLAGLAIYFNCGNQDEFGFEKGAAALHDQLKTESVRHEYHLYPGNHGAEFFLAHLGETLKFHSRVFAPTPLPSRPKSN
jgi:S-formylglutathione hydrolase FrmB